jgi:hypothetical protein
MRRLLLLISLLLTACDSRGALTHLNKDTPVNPLTEAKANLAFTCVHETIPQPSAEADVLFQYARWLQNNNQLKQDRTVDVEIERLYRIASENGHYKANINLQNGSMRGHFKLSGDEHLRMSQSLIDAGVATGYYFVGIFLQQGSAGLKQDTEMALRYFRKAADQGSAQAQYDVGEQLEPIDIAPEIALQMYRCSAEQGHGEAALALGEYLQDNGRHREAVEAFQIGVAAGNESAAAFLNDGFRGPESTDELNYLGLPVDIERAERYKKIWEVLANASYANPKVPEINEILPLPPAKLPAWDGILQWQKTRRANVPPEKPSEALIRELAKAKLLNPVDGKPMPDSPAFIRVSSYEVCYSGEACKQSGYWQITFSYREHSATGQHVVRHFEQGDIMPTHMVVRSKRRMWPLSDQITQREERVRWDLLG